MEIGSNDVRMVLYSHCSLLLSIGMHGRIDNWGKGAAWVHCMDGKGGVKKLACEGVRCFEYWRGNLSCLVAYQSIKYLMLLVPLRMMNRACRRDERNLGRARDELEMTNLEHYG